MLDAVALQERLASRIGASLRRYRDSLGVAASEHVEELAALLADEALLELDDALAQAGANQPQGILAAALPNRTPAPDPSAALVQGEEQLLWSGRPFLAIGDYVELSTHWLRLRRGLLLNVAYEQIELKQISKIEIKRGLYERVFALGDLHVFSGNTKTAQLILPNMADPEALRERILAAVAAAPTNQQRS